MPNSHSRQTQPSLFDKQTFKAAADFCCKYYILGLFLIYAIGTFILVIRNLAAGFPFTTLSVIQYAMIIFYAALMVAPLVIVNVAQRGIYKKRSQLNFFDKLKLAFRLLSWQYLFIILFALVLWTIFLGNPALVVLCVLPAYIIAPLLGIFQGPSSWLVKMIVYMAIAWIVILQIPISAGGFKAFPVKFCAFTSEECQIYTFFGEANGLYQFRDDNDVLLIPVDSGYIRYDKNLTHFYYW